jgi:hypothetical protein
MPSHVKSPSVASSSSFLLAVGALAGAFGCKGDDGLPDVAACPGLTCPERGIAEGNFAISGLVGMDGFFAAVVNVRSAAANVSGSMRAELEGMARGLGLADVEMLSTEELGAMVAAGIEAKISANLSGGLTIEFRPPKCEADLEVTAKAAAECDVEADPGSIEAKCEGTCEVSAEVAAECSAMGTLSCSGQAPNFACEGTCSGSCQLEVAAACEGSCNGQREGECSACAGGACDNQGGVVANCAGSCSGMCSGECKLEAGGSCSGRCEGSCEYTPPSGMCEANATAKCDVSAMAEAKCEGKCEGNVTPPMVKAKCSAQVEAKAKAEVVCTPPALSVAFQFKPDLGADAQAEFKAWLDGFEGRFAAMLAVRSKGEFVLDAAGGLVAASVDEVPASIEAVLEAELELKTALGLACSLGELPSVPMVLAEATQDLEASVSAFAKVSAAVGA